MTLNLHGCNNDEKTDLLLDINLEPYINYVDKATTDTFRVGESVYLRFQFNVDNPLDKRLDLSYRIQIPDSQDASNTISRNPGIDLKEGETVNEEGRSVTRYDGLFQVPANQSRSVEFWMVITGLRSQDSGITIFFEAEDSANVNLLNFNLDRPFFQRIDFTEPREQMPRVTELRLDDESNRIEWHGEDNAQFSWKLYKASVEEPIDVMSETRHTTVDLSTLSEGSFRFEIIQKSNSSNVLDSKVLSLEFARLTTPSVSVVRGELRWDSVLNADRYRIQFNSAPPEETRSLFFDLNRLNDLSPGFYTLTVTALPRTNSCGHLSSPCSMSSEESNQISIRKLETPFINRLGVNRISWNQIREATLYRIYIDGNFETETNGTIYTLTGGPSRVVTIRAISDSNIIISSNMSNPLEIEEFGG